MSRVPSRKKVTRYAGEKESQAWGSQNPVGYGNVEKTFHVSSSTVSLVLSGGLFISSLLTGSLSLPSFGFTGPILAKQT